MSKVAKLYNSLTGKLTEIDKQVNEAKLVVDNLQRKKTEIEMKIASHKDKFYTRDGQYYVTGKVRYTAEYRSIMDKPNATKVLTIMDISVSSGEKFDVLRLSDGNVVSQYWIQSA